MKRKSIALSKLTLKKDTITSLDKIRGGDVPTKFGGCNTDSICNDACAGSWGPCFTYDPKNCAPTVPQTIHPPCAATTFDPPTVTTC